MPNSPPDFLLFTHNMNKRYICIKWTSACHLEQDSVIISVTVISIPWLAYRRTQATMIVSTSPELLIFRQETPPDSPELPLHRVEYPYTFFQVSQDVADLLLMVHFKKGWSSTLSIHTYCWSIFVSWLLCTLNLKCFWQAVFEECC